MSNVAMRQRRTVPLEEESNHSIPVDARGYEDYNNFDLRTPSTSGSRGISSSSGRVRRKRNDSVPASPASFRHLEPIRNSFLNQRSSIATSGHSRGSTISTEELKRSLRQKRKNGSVPKTPSDRSRSLTIGSSSRLGGSRSLNLQSTPLPSLAYRNAPSPTDTPLSAMPDLFSLEQALHGVDDSKIEASISKRRHSKIRSLSAWKTPFEVDAPREQSIVIPRSPSPNTIESEESASANNPNLSEEQDAWAGIDELLDTQSLDGSCTFSVSDILPRATVRKMRQDPNLRALDEGNEEEYDDDDDESGTGESRMSKRSLGSISKVSASESSHSRPPKPSRRSKTSEPEPSWTDYQKSSSTTRPKDRLHDNKGSSSDKGATASGSSGGGGLFDVFHWSEKDNVDEERQRKTKLNSRARKVKMLNPSSRHSSDDCSLPSLADFSTRSDLESIQSKGSVVTEVTEFFDLEDKDDANSFFSENDNKKKGGARMTTSSSLGNDGLVLDKKVDEYIRQIQKRLPAIAEDSDSPVRAGLRGKKGHVGFIEENSPSPTGVTDESPFDELPSLNSLSHRYPDFQDDEENSSKKHNNKRKEEKKEKKSISFQVKNSIKKMREKSKSSKVVNLGEEKYFPDTVKPEKSKKFSANRCLLSEGDGDDDANWN